MVRERLVGIAGRMWADGMGWILIVISVGWFLSLGTRLIYPVLIPEIALEFGIDYTSAGITLSVLWLGYALMSLPGGVLADRLGERWVLTGSLLVGILGIGLVVTAPAFGIFVVASFILGSGLGFFGTTGTTILADVYDDGATTAIGLSQVVGNVGTILLPVIAGLLVAVAGWRLGLAYVLPIFVIVVVGIWVIVPRRTSPQAGSDDQSWRRTVARIGRTFIDRTLVLIIVAMSSLAFVYQGLSGFLPAYLIDVKALDHTLASLLFGLMFVGMMIGMIASGPVSDHIGERNAMIGFSIMSMPPVLALPYVENLGVIIFLVVCAGLMGGFFPVSMTYVIRFIPDDIQGSVFGVVRTLFNGIGVLGPPTVGVLADAGFFDMGILVLGGIGILAVGASLLLPQISR
ncbi:major facilitator superfamily MFS_1 [Halalkaliarchaeum desulfuricum]|uniref:Major facilitator superfamily MFS_1 n=1 Tax=Halalkaliarchaeum desulfuricum TaxID=2055893 RepID=A0A343TLA7_9EURY|nr:MFS transporter [Halalkaliarchaeum desulfuricum]AUX09879.1 major facilitator superfamily MFS_1 [Halalkaliarchaeum desulfuricum]